MIKNSKPYCDMCGNEMQQLCDCIGFPYQKAKTHVCNHCFDVEFEAQWKEDDPCGQCETEPCERGYDCWYTPPILHLLPYETYYADRPLKTLPF